MREPFDDTVNIVWQHRGGDPSPHVDALAGALEKLFGEEIYELSGIVARLNEQGLTTEDGQSWTEENFQAELKRLGKKEFG